MGEMGKKNIGHRRQVLQLRDTPASYGLGYQPPQPTAEGNSGLSGLISSYVDSDPDDTDDSPDHTHEDPPMHQSTLLATKAPRFIASGEVYDGVKSSDTDNKETSMKLTLSNGNTETAESTGHEAKDDVNAKVMDFLAEIGAMETADGTNDADTEAEHPPQPPKEPVTLWQQCLDEKTQCCYYWHTHTNEVMWEIPAEYSQYLLLYKEYETSLERHQLLLEKWEKSQAERKNQRDEKSTEPKLIKEDGQTTAVKLEIDEDQSKETQQCEKDIGLEPVSVKLVEATNDLHQNEMRVMSKEESKVSSDTDVSKPFIGPLLPESANDTEGNTEEETDFDFDVDDIDAQLDQALEKEMAPKSSSKERKRQSSGSPLTEVEQVPAKKLCTNTTKICSRSSTEEGEHSMYRINTEEIKDRQNMLSEVSELSNLLLDKLEFMEIHQDSLSKPQILLIEIQTRLADWKAGQLPTSYLLTKLQQATAEMSSCECDMVPGGWSCQWDREYGRYFYIHKVTGDSQWDYPQGDVDEERSVQGQALLDGRTSIGPWQPPKYAENRLINSSSQDVAIEQSAKSCGLRSDNDLVQTLLNEPPPPPPPCQPSSPPPPPPNVSDPSLPTDTVLSVSHEPPPPGTTPAGNQSSAPCLVASYSMSDSESDDESDQESVHSAKKSSPPHSPENENNIPSYSHTKDPHTLSAPPLLHPQLPDQDMQPASSIVSDDGSDGELNSQAVEQLHVTGAPDTSEISSPKHSSKKKKKEKALVSSLSMKKKGVPSLVQKWQQVQKDHIPDK